MKVSRCMKCGELVSGKDSVYLVAEDRTPSDTSKGFSCRKLTSATLCHACGKLLRVELVDWLGRGAR